MLFTAVAMNAATRIIYLQPNADWKSDGARFAICILSEPQEWVDMTAVSGENGIYSAVVPTDKQVIFCRMNGAAEENIWGNKWNQTQDMTLEGVNDMCVISGWDNAGSWAKFTGCDWANIDWVGASDNKLKVCKEGDVPSIVNVQKPGFADESGIYMTFPSAAWDESKFSLPASKYATQGAGMVIYLSALDLEYNEITISTGGIDYEFTVYNADGAEEIYAVAGSSATLFGTTWDTYANKMTLNEGIYKLEKTEVELAAGDIAFKVVKNHSWDSAWPENDYVLNIPSDGIYTITITFNPDSKVITANAEKTGEAVVVPEIKLHGNFAGVDWADTEAFEVAEGKLTATLELTLAKGSYEFGLKKDGTWTANGVAFTRANASAEVVSGEGNLTLNADVADKYTFTWTYATNTLAITYPVKYYEFATGHAKDAAYADASARILLTLSKSGNDVVVTIKNNNAAGNPKTGLNYLWVNAEGANGVARYGNGTHSEADAEEVSAIVEFNAAKETYNFINIHWAYSGWEGEWAIDGLAVPATALCDLVDGYYLVGEFGGVEAWDAADLTPAKRFAANPGNAAEYMLAGVTLTAGDALKVVKVKNDGYETWYAENNYVVNAAHAGEKTIYFRPDGQGQGEDWHEGLIYIEKNSGTAIDNTVENGEVVKFIRNGQLFINLNGKTYNVTGEVVR